MAITEIHFTFGDHLRRVRLDAEIKRDEMAARLGISGGTISNYENGHTRPTKSRVRLWAEVCDADPDLLLHLCGWIDVEIPVAA
jgi:transcriptional regulator with XRE-family HTH domain